MPPKVRPALSTAKARKTLIEKRIFKSLESWTERCLDLKRVLLQDDSLDVKQKRRRFIELMNDRPRKRMALLRAAKAAFEMAGVNVTFKPIPEEDIDFENVHGEPFVNRGRDLPKGKNAKREDDDDEDAEEAAGDSDSEASDKDDDDDATAAQEAEPPAKRKRGRPRKDAARPAPQESDIDEDDEIANVIVDPKSRLDTVDGEPIAYIIQGVDPTLTAEEQKEEHALVVALDKEQVELINDINMLLQESGTNSTLTNVTDRLTKIQGSLHLIRAERLRTMQKLYYRFKVEKKLSEVIMNLRAEVRDLRAGRIDTTKTDVTLFGKSIVPTLETFYQEHPLTTQHVRDIATSVLVAITQCVDSYKLPKVRTDSKLKGSRRERLLSKLRHGLSDALNILERADPTIYTSYAHRGPHAHTVATAGSVPGAPGPVGALGAIGFPATSPAALNPFNLGSGLEGSAPTGAVAAVAASSIAAATTAAAAPAAESTAVTTSSAAALPIDTASSTAADSAAGDAVTGGKRKRGAANAAGGRRPKAGSSSLLMGGDGSEYYVTDPMIAMATAAAQHSQRDTRMTFRLPATNNDDSEDEAR